MKKILSIILGLMVVIMVSAFPADASRGGGRHGGGGHFRVGVFLGPGLWGPGWWGPAPYPYYPQPVIVQPPAEIYLQTAPQAEEPVYWYYCQESQGYYPYVKRCPNGWMKVVPPTNPPQGEE